VCLCVLSPDEGRVMEKQVVTALRRQIFAYDCRTPGMYMTETSSPGLPLKVGGSVWKNVTFRLNLNYYT
jgi:hypothetical protein